MRDKIKYLLKSKRFWALISGLVVVSAKELGIAELDETQVEAVAGLFMAWLIGESYRPSDANTQ